MSADAITTSADGMARILAIKSRPKPPNLFSSVGTLAWRAMLKIKHVPFQLFDVTVTPIMFTLLFTSIFSGALEAVTGGDYLRYLLPGILVQTVIFITVYTGVGLNSDIQKGLYDRFRSLPIWQPSPVFGALAGDLFRYSVACIVVLVVGLLLGFRGDPLGTVLAILCVLLFAFAVSWIWIIIGMKVKTPESVMTMSFVFLMPLTFASDIFVPSGTVKWEWLRVAMQNNPVTHLAGAARSFMIGTPMDDHLWWVLGSSAVITLVFAPLALWMYHKER